MLDEYLRAFPLAYGELLELLVMEPNEVVRSADVGQLWAMLEPLFCGWALQLDASLDPKEKGKVGRTLNRFGDILPWDDDAKGSTEKRQRAVDNSIDAVYARAETEQEKARKAVYWAATRARNDQVHRSPDSLVGRVRPLDLIRDVAALAAVASLRFRLRIAADTKSQASVPSLAGLSQAAVRSNRK